MFWLQIQCVKFWCWLTRAEAVYIKDLDDHSVSVKVMRTKFDPFVDSPDKRVYFRRYGYRICRPNGTVGSGSWLWRYVDQSKHVQQRLSN